jgi:hypothetical protein
LSKTFSGRYFPIAVIAAVIFGIKGNFWSSEITVFLRRTRFQYGP